MRRKFELVGKRFAKLVVLKEVEKKQPGSWWLCKCDCGKEKIVSGRNLMYGGVRSCGCIAIEDLTNQIFSYLSVTSTYIRKKGRIHWGCVCSCGKIIYSDAHHLKNGHTKSCGCYKEVCMVTHGESLNNRTREYQTWDAMIQRCTNSNNAGRKDYKDRGISVCEGWREYENFLKDMGRRPSDDHSLDRKDNNGNYSCGHCKECITSGWVFNCRWATDPIQKRNTRRNKWLEHNGRRMILMDWALELKVSETGIVYHLKRGKVFSWIYNHFAATKNIRNYNPKRKNRNPNYERQLTYS